MQLLFLLLHPSAAMPQVSLPMISSLQEEDAARLHRAATAQAAAVQSTS
jgi:hypothetical protein